MTTRPVNALRGEFEALLGGEPVRFDTTLASVAMIEARCGDAPLVDIVNKAVFGRRAADQLALITAALAAAGWTEAEALAARTSVSEAEAFILALIEALGFTVRQTSGGGARPDPFRAGAPAGVSAGTSGAPLPSVP